MERVKRLGGYQKGLLLLMAGMIVLFAVLYPVTVAKSGFRWNNKILTCTQENGAAVYSGRYRGAKARFTVRDGVVEFQYGAQYFGPYTAREDPSAVTESLRGPGMTGVALYCGDECIFRGAVSYAGKLMYFRTDGGGDIPLTTTESGNGSITYAGEPEDAVEPSVRDILELMYGPRLEHKGLPGVFFLGLLLCVLNAASMLYADELFRWNLRFQIRDADRAEPSDWELASRYIVWTGLLIGALAVFILGLR